MKKSMQNGFTLIELLLAMSFVSALLLGIAMTILQISQIYNRGVTLNEVNQSGRSITQDIEAGIQQSSGLAPGTVPTDPTALITPNTNHYRVDQFGGRLCVGQYSYIWNYANTLKVGNNSHLNLYTVPSGVSPNINFLKIPDPGGSYCRGKNSDNSINNKLPLVDPNGGGSEMLQSGDHQLAIHSLTVTTNQAAIDSASNQILYNLTFVIGTDDTTLLKSFDPARPDDILCKGPSEGGDLEYCSVEEFTIAVRASNALN